MVSSFPWRTTTRAFVLSLTAYQHRERYFFEQHCFYFTARTRKIIFVVAEKSSFRKCDTLMIFVAILGSYKIEGGVRLGEFGEIYSAQVFRLSKIKLQSLIQARLAGQN